MAPLRLYLEYFISKKHIFSILMYIVIRLCSIKVPGFFLIYTWLKITTVNKKLDSIARSYKIEYFIRGGGVKINIKSITRNGIYFIL